MFIGSRSARPSVEVIDVEVIACGGIDADAHDARAIAGTSSTRTPAVAEPPSSTSAPVGCRLLHRAVWAARFVVEVNAMRRPSRTIAARSRARRMSPVSPSDADEIPDPHVRPAISLRRETASAWPSGASAMPDVPRRRLHDGHRRAVSVNHCSVAGGATGVRPHGERTGGRHRERHAAELRDRNAREQLDWFTDEFERRFIERTSEQAVDSFPKNRCPARTRATTG